MQTTKLSVIPQIRISIVAIRCCCITALLLNSIVISWTTLICCIVLFLSYLTSATKNSVEFSCDTSNPLKGNAAMNLSDELAIEVGSELVRKSFEIACLNSNKTLQLFKPIQNGSACLFARKAKIFSAGNYNPRLCIAGNAAAYSGTLRLLCSLLAEVQIDGIVMEIPESHSQNLTDFSSAVYATLRALAACDDHKDCIENKEHQLNQRGWVFEFAQTTFFVTTFAPFYPHIHSRFSYGTKCGFVLLQPEISFARIDLPFDSVHTTTITKHANLDTNHANSDTNHANSKMNSARKSTIRDSIRDSFTRSGQKYPIRHTVRYPMISDIVMPINYWHENRDQDNDNDVDSDSKLIENLEWWQLVQKKYMNNSDVHFCGNVEKY